MAQLNPGLGLVGIGKQTAKGTPAASPAFGHGLYSGTLPHVERDVQIDEVTSGAAGDTSAFLASIIGASDYECPAYFGSAGLYLLAALGADAVTGAGPTYTHVITLALPRPYFTLWGSLSGIIQSLQDCKLDQLELTWKANEPLHFKPTWKGGALTMPATYVPGTAESGDSRWTPVGGTFQIDVVGSTLAAVLLTQGSIKINNNVDTPLCSGSITPADILEDKQQITISLSALVSDLAYWKEALTGTPTGTAPASVVAYGSFSVQFVNGTSTLTLACTNCPFNVDFPAVDAKNANREVTLTAQPTIASGGSTILTATVVNSVPSY